jgi:carboxypeptidase C (cathepsin A)
MIGLFQENRLRRLNVDGNVILNLNSWSNVSKMIYIDQPTEIGKMIPSERASADAK